MKHTKFLNVSYSRRFKYEVPDDLANMTIYDETKGETLFIEGNRVVKKSEGDLGADLYLYALGALSSYVEEVKDGLFHYLQFELESPFDKSLNVGDRVWKNYGSIFFDVEGNIYLQRKNKRWFCVNKKTLFEYPYFDRIHKNNIEHLSKRSIYVDKLTLDFNEIYTTKNQEESLKELVNRYNEFDGKVNYSPYFFVDWLREFYK